MPTNVNLSWTQKYNSALMKFNGKHPDTYTEAQRTELKLLRACLEALNKALYVCEDMPSLLETGSLIDAHIGTYGRVTTNHFPLYYGFDFERPVAIFTEPHSENYCIQSLYLKKIIPEPRPVHGYPSKDIMQILKLRLDENTYLCNTPFPDFFTNEDIAERMLSQVTPRNMSSPIATVYKTIINLTQTAAYQNINMNISLAANEIHKVRFMNVTPTYNFSGTIVRSHLQNVRDIFVKIATEPYRMRLADDIKDLDIMRRLVVVGRLSHLEIKKLFKIFNEHVIDNDSSSLCKANATLTRPINFQDIIFTPETFEYLSKHQIGILDFLMSSANLNATHALALVDEYSLEWISSHILNGCTHYTAKYIISEFAQHNVPYNTRDMALCAAHINQSNFIEQFRQFLFVDEMRELFADNKPEMQLVMQVFMYTIAIALLITIMSRNTLIAAPVKYAKQRFFSPRNDRRTHDEEAPLLSRVQNRNSEPKANTIKIVKKR